MGSAKPASTPRGGPVKSVESEDRNTIVAVDTSQTLVEDDTLTYGKLRKIPSDPSLSALHPASPTSPQVTTPITPSLTNGTSSVTDDEDGDYQSAYSTSPRGSYGSFEKYSNHPDEASDSDLGTPTNVAKEYVVDLEPSYRNRASSTSTAKGPKHQYKPNEDTIPSSPIGRI